MREPTKGDLVRLHINRAIAVVARTRHGHLGDHVTVRRPGTVREIPQQACSVITPSDAPLRRFDRSTIARLEHPAACPDCGECGRHATTKGGWDRLWCDGCGAAWDVLSAILDEADLTVCSTCEATLIDAPGECEACTPDGARAGEEVLR